MKVSKFRAAPPCNLGEPVRKFEDTFSADKMVYEKFFGKKECQSGGEISQSPHKAF